MKGLVVGVPRGEIAAKVKVLLRLRGPEPKYFSQIGNHASRVPLRRREDNVTTAGRESVAVAVTGDVLLRRDGMVETDANGRAGAAAGRTAVFGTYVSCRC